MRASQRLRFGCHEFSREAHHAFWRCVAGRDVQDFSKIRERNSLRSRRGRCVLSHRTDAFRWREVSAVHARWSLGYLGGMDVLDT